MRPLLALALLAALCATAHSQVDVHASAMLADRGGDPRIFEPVEVTVIAPLDRGPRKNLRDVHLMVDFVSPAGRNDRIPGFYYDRLPSGRSIWKARHLPDEIGRWSFSVTLDDSIGSASFSGKGVFQCLPGSEGGPSRVGAARPDVWVDAVGRLQHVIGVNDEFGLDAGGSADPSLGLGAFFGPPAVSLGPEGLSAYAQAGVSHVRLRNKFNHHSICTDGTAPGDGVCERYLNDVALLFDREMVLARREGMRPLYSIFGNRYQDSQYTSQLSSDQRFLMRYSVARWGALVDQWQLANEKSPTLQWTRSAAGYLRSVDPYDRPISQSWSDHPVPAQSEIDANAPHWYENHGLLEGDRKIGDYAERVGLGGNPPWKSYGKPVLLAELGTRKAAGTPLPGNYAWKPKSEVDARIKSWASTFQQLGFFWFQRSVSTAANGGLFLGRAERQQLQVLRRFTEWVGDHPATAPVAAAVSVPGQARVLGLASPQGLGVYLHHSASHSTLIQGLSVTIDCAFSGRGSWVDPATGRVLDSGVAVHPGPNTIQAPPFRVDLAFAATPGTISVPPLALYVVDNPQWAGAGSDLDGDGRAEYGPAEPAHGRAPLSLNLDAQPSIDWDGGPLEVHGDFGDGSSASGAQAVHTWFGRGVFRCVLSVTDDEGEKAQQTFLVRTSADPHPDSNDPPRFRRASHAGDVYTTPGRAVVITLEAFDLELKGGVYRTETLTFDGPTLPAGAVLGQFEHDGAQAWAPVQLKFTPDTDQLGSHDVVLRVRDPQGASDQISLKIHVLPIFGPQLTSYCEGKTNSLGCVPYVYVVGQPSASSGLPFKVVAKDVLPSQVGLLLYGTRRASRPFHGARLCLRTPFERMYPVQLAQPTGSGSCRGTLAADFNARIASGVDPQLIPGAKISAQWMQRDPQDPSGWGDGLSNGLQFTIQP